MLRQHPLHFGDAFWELGWHFSWSRARFSLLPGRRTPNKPWPGWAQAVSCSAWGDHRLGHCLSAAVSPSPPKPGWEQRGTEPFAASPAASPSSPEPGAHSQRRLPRSPAAEPIVPFVWPFEHQPARLEASPPLRGRSHARPSSPPPDPLSQQARGRAPPLTPAFAPPAAPRAGGSSLPPPAPAGCSHPLKRRGGQRRAPAGIFQRTLPSHGHPAKTKRMRVAGRCSHTQRVHKHGQGNEHPERRGPPSTLPWKLQMVLKAKLRAVGQQGPHQAWGPTPCPLGQTSNRASPMGAEPQGCPVSFPPPAAHRGDAWGGGAESTPRFLQPSIKGFPTPLAPGRAGVGFTLPSALPPSPSLAPGSKSAA